MTVSTLLLWRRRMDGSLLRSYAASSAPWQLYNSSGQVGGTEIAGNRVAFTESMATAHVFARSVDGSPLPEFYEAPNPASLQLCNHASDVGGMKIPGNPSAFLHSGGSFHVFATSATPLDSSMQAPRTRLAPDCEYGAA